ncbi:hypothetical protein [Streptomyces mobaraensis]|uniref:Uncharacterized protein n=1 Tax=Streptomyces mobaraensis TaxID=35621 RepID=A0A5N5W595_STRMB|nr:hypothetical protein [Streptomyces mobaraensis]KAB7839492.1 hypothetical protein FRZ00_21370 [Streptomyces mobaraensis]
MGAIENHTALMYGYRLGGPADDWVGLASDLTRYSADGDSWLMPQVSWATDAMREENHSDHFASAAEERLVSFGLGELLLRTYSIGPDDEGLILAAVVREPDGKPLALDPVAMSDASQYDAPLARALSVLELHAHAAKPEWIWASHYA